VRANGSKLESVIEQNKELIIRMQEEEEQLKSQKEIRRTIRSGIT
jgi:hypothetical protein